MSMRLAGLAARSGCRIGIGWAVLLGAAASPALATNAACPGASSSTATQCVFTGAGTYQFNVPSGVSSLDVVAVGAAGGVGYSGGTPGKGASVEDAAVSVSPNAGLSVVVGGPGAGSAEEHHQAMDHWDDEGGPDVGLAPGDLD
jgi:hypothetical protein